MRKLRIGMIGIGVGGAEILPAMDTMESIELVAGAGAVNGGTRFSRGERALQGLGMTEVMGGLTGRLDPRPPQGEAAGSWRQQSRQNPQKR